MIEQGSQFLYRGRSLGQVFFAVVGKEGLVICHGIEFLAAVARDTEFREVTLIDALFGTVAGQLAF
jgi:hypothetical protein